MSVSLLDVLETGTVRPPPAEVKRMLGYPDDHELEGAALELSRQAAAVFEEEASPWIAAVEVGVQEVLETGVLLESGAFLDSAFLAARLRLAAASRAVAFAATLGERLDRKIGRLWAEERPDAAYFLEAHAAAAVGVLIELARKAVCDRAEPAGLAALPHHSPGYKGWPLRDQVVLHDVVASAPESCVRDRIRLLESGMLEPTKSILGLFALTSNTALLDEHRSLVPCRACSMANCAYRRAPRSRRTGNDGGAR